MKSGYCCHKSIYLCSDKMKYLKGVKRCKSLTLDDLRPKKKKKKLYKLVILKQKYKTKYFKLVVVVYIINTCV